MKKKNKIYKNEIDFSFKKYLIESDEADASVPKDAGSEKEKKWLSKLISKTRSPAFDKKSLKNKTILGLLNKVSFGNFQQALIDIFNDKVISKLDDNKKTELWKEIASRKDVQRAHEKDRGEKAKDIDDNENLEADENSFEYWCFMGEPETRKNIKALLEKIKSISKKVEKDVKKELKESKSYNNIIKEYIEHGTRSVLHKFKNLFDNSDVSHSVTMSDTNGVFNRSAEFLKHLPNGSVKKLTEEEYSLELIQQLLSNVKSSDREMVLSNLYKELAENGGGMVNPLRFSDDIANSVASTYNDYINGKLSNLDSYYENILSKDDIDKIWEEADSYRKKAEEIANGNEDMIKNLPEYKKYRELLKDLRYEKNRVEAKKYMDNMNDEIDTSNFDNLDMDSEIEETIEKAQEYQKSTAEALEDVDIDIDDSISDSILDGITSAADITSSIGIAVAWKYRKNIKRMVIGALKKYSAKKGVIAEMKFKTKLNEEDVKDKKLSKGGRNYSLRYNIKTHVWKCVNENDINKEVSEELVSSVLEGEIGKKFREQLAKIWDPIFKSKDGEPPAFLRLMEMDESESGISKKESKVLKDIGENYDKILKNCISDNFKYDIRIGK